MYIYIYIYIYCYTLYTTNMTGTHIGQEASVPFTFEHAWSSLSPARGSIAGETLAPRSGYINYKRVYIYQKRVYIY